jgi:energy-coupling factor transporter ATP-binding protein EcfA2
MYIEKIRLKDVRCFEAVSIDLTKDKPGTSVLIAGNNGTGKSTVLRAIAMGLCDRDSASGLLRELEGNYVREGALSRSTSRSAEIAIDLREGDKTYAITTIITQHGQSIIDTVEQKYTLEQNRRQFRAFSIFWNQLFVAGYGAGLRTAGTAKYSDYFPLDAVYSLFKYDAPLQDPEIAWRRLVDASDSSRAKNWRAMRERTSRIIAQLLGHVLALDAQSKIVLLNSGIFVARKKELIPLDAMGDGHKSLAKLTLDILIWYLLKKNFDWQHKGDARHWRPIQIDRQGRTDVRGIVIIDEIEQHLHPRLQRQILKRLSGKFPMIQFIVTTHSPLCVSGTADVESRGGDGYAVYGIGRKPDGVVLDRREVPRGLRSDQILLDYFELPTTLNVSTEEELEELHRLTSVPVRRRSAEQKQKIRRLLNKIREYDFSLAEKESDRESQREFATYLAKRKA